MSNSSASRRMSRIDHTDLSMHVDSCLRELMDRGYARHTIDGYRRGLAHFSRWVTRHRTSWNSEDELVRRFLSSRGRSHDRPTLSAALHHLLRRARGRIVADRPLSKRKYNASTHILSGLAAWPLRRAKYEPTSFVDSYMHVFRAVLSTSAIASPNKFAGLSWTLWKDGSRVP